LRIVNLRADDVGGQHVRRELQAGKLDVMAGGQDLTERVLARPGTPSSKDVAVGQQADDQPLDQIILADDDLAEFVEQRCVNALASFTASLMALIPVLIEQRQHRPEKCDGKNCAFVQ
jgi:hypothetical protein